MLAPVGVVGEIEDVLPRGGQVGADGDPRCLGDSLASAVFSHHTGPTSTTASAVASLSQTSVYDTC